MMQAYVEWVVRHRRLVIALMILVSGLLATEIRRLHVVINTSTLLPQDHPYVVGSTEIERVFGARRVVIVGIGPKEGDVYAPTVLRKIQRITSAILEAPALKAGNVLSLASKRAKYIGGTADGIVIHPLMEKVPETPEEIDALRRSVRANPIYSNSIVSSDERTAAVIAEVEIAEGGFRKAIDALRALVEPEREPSVDIFLSGLPVFTAQIEGYSQRTMLLFPVALVLMGLIHYEAFRTVQALLLPLVTALLAVVWALGAMGLARVPLDAFNSSTPILVLAVAAGHAVQILKRYYEEYHVSMAAGPTDAQEANRAAVVRSLTRIGPVMLTAGGVAALSFFSLTTFHISTVRTFGVLTGIGIVSALVLEMTFIPALRSALPAPGLRERRRESEHGGWDRITEAVARLVNGRGRARIFAVVAILAALWVWGASRLVVDNAPDSYFFHGLPFQRDFRALNDRLAGVTTLSAMVATDEDEGLTDPAVMRGVAAMQRFLEREPYVGKTLSIADLVKQLHRAMNGGDPAADEIPDRRDLISQYLLLYSLSGDPADLDAYVDPAHRAASIRAFLKTSSSAYVGPLLARLQEFAEHQFGDRVRVQFGGNGPELAALNEVLVHAKILNMLQIAGVIFVIASLVFRSLVAGLLVLVPLMLAVLANFGFMGLFGIPLNVPTSTIAATAVGIGADYAIYLIYRFREELARSANEADAFRAALTTAGKAILFVASAVAGGYGVLLLSYGFYPHIWGGTLIATAMIVSSMSALAVLPALIVSLRPRFIFHPDVGHAVPSAAAATNPDLS